MALATVRKELNLISNLFNVARTEWKMKGLLNPLADVKKPPAWAQPNTARFNDAEQRKKLYDALEQQNQFTNKKNCSVRFSTVKAVQFALETAVRRGETCACGRTFIWKSATCKWSGQRIITRKSKAVIVRCRYRAPLWRSSRAPAPLQAAQRVFPVAPSVITRVVREARRAAKLPEHIKFHTMRHEATSAFMERGLNPVEVGTRPGRWMLCDVTPTRSARRR